MPTLSVFFRKDDVPRWKRLENKSEWLHDKLSQDTSLDGDQAAGSADERQSETEVLQQAVETPIEELPPEAQDLIKELDRL